jgi:hypothetical protein
MAYQSHDANIIEATLERVITERGLPGSGLSDREAREALEALHRLLATEGGLLIQLERLNGVVKDLSDHYNSSEYYTSTLYGDVRRAVARARGTYPVVW